MHVYVFFAHLDASLLWALTMALLCHDQVECQDMSDVIRDSLGSTCKGGAGYGLEMSKWGAVGPEDSQCAQRKIQADVSRNHDGSSLTVALLTWSVGFGFS